MLGIREQSPCTHEASGISLHFSLCHFQFAHIIFPGGLPRPSSGHAYSSAIPSNNRVHPLPYKMKFRKIYRQSTRMACPNMSPFLDSIGRKPTTFRSGELCNMPWWPIDRGWITFWGFSFYDYDEKHSFMLCRF
ncbi:hypothetical protein EJ08DRAFT_398051 [Tothia fuscella]|uniref:Uncharacterized protein n=1 Tax=Tothia fuscella TaxID=1048955 RepID=A0A9P4TVE7_9PEZI|nr:hypothetical protein EJ08DRAFT_398051 [Tothia fuscella]